MMAQIRPERLIYRKKHDAFTLIELMVVCAIIVIIASLLLMVISKAKRTALQTDCLNNVRQILLGIQMYSGDANDKAPTAELTNMAPWIAYKELVKNYVGLHGASSTNDMIFACPADIFYYDYNHGRVPKSHHDQAIFDFSSYTFNGMNELPAGPHRPKPGVRLLGIAGFRLASIKHPARTVMIAESPAFYPYSWHKPESPQPRSVGPPGVAMFNNAENNVGFVDGHAAYIKIYWRNIMTNGFMACENDPPSGYDYQWSAD